MFITVSVPLFHRLKTPSLPNLRTSVLNDGQYYSDAPDLLSSCAKLRETVQAKFHFPTFQTQPGKASRRCRRLGFIRSLVLL